MTIYSWALIITHNRPVELNECVNLIAPQVDNVLIIDNASDPPVDEADFSWAKPVKVMHIPDQPPNIARMWNRGWDHIGLVMREMEHRQWNIAMLCDDVIVPSDWMARVSTFMRDTASIAGAAHGARAITQGFIKREPDRDIWNRMQGAAYVIAGEYCIRADETMHWWWCDTDIDWQARVTGGMAIAPGPIAINTKPNDFTHSKPELTHQAGLDGEAFTAKWGFKPW